jgi:isocitrate dehydrogenase
VFEALLANEEKITAEMIALQGKPSDIGGYYKPDENKLNLVMRPSSTLNSIIESI